MNSVRMVLLLAALSLVLTSLAVDTVLPDPATLRTWIANMKESPRGPFSRIRWFCNDDTVLPPRSYGCRDHGGGSQHGEWTERAKLLRSHGFYIANVYADLDTDAFAGQSGHWDVFAQMLIEQYLIGVDDGWILRKARFYRGALQEAGVGSRPTSDFLSIEVSSTNSSLRPLASSENDVHRVLQSQV